jgi:hypothetical protein
MALAEATRAYLKMPARERAAAARTLADQYDWDHVVQDFALTLKARARGSDEMPQTGAMLGE